METVGSLAVEVEMVVVTAVGMVEGLAVVLVVDMVVEVVPCRAGRAVATEVVGMAVAVAVVKVAVAMVAVEMVVAMVEATVAVAMVGVEIVVTAASVEARVPRAAGRVAAKAAVRAVADWAAAGRAVARRRHMSRRQRWQPSCS